MRVFINEEGKNEDTISMKCNKAIENMKEIKNTLDSLKLGKFFMEAAILVRNSVFVGSLLYGVEVLFNLSKKNINNLKKKDEEFLSMLLGADFSGPRSMLYLETGVEPIDILIKKTFIFKVYPGSRRFISNKKNIQ